ncbi:phosphate ABC transporter substrate-binding protein, PhoT family [Ilyomonas limi]|uniref:Phosphate ABC transporter substrate-binding protein, PhoT family n=1 Tax=Ilyomonas limi TaxID=2575867 RepID=A0A4V5UUD8_9BACT|nr:substrate-binding domain-containing protein [Ilyomonas limi]TKK68633.1 phosphate ABC transporter substrate-binding protein, PhoT family [Ilyomonas limi]
MEHIKNNIVLILLIVLCCWCISACKSNNSKSYDEVYDSPQKGTIHISVDETFKPVITEQIKVYESSYPGTHIIAEYKSEADCFRDLNSDSTRMVIVAKSLTAAQIGTMEDKLSYRPKQDILAYDAVSVIVNNESKDSLFTVEQLQKLLTADTATIQVVVDGNNATSTVRYLQDSILHGKPFGKNVRAVEGGSHGVIDYIAQNKNAVGFVGSSWVGNMDDPQQVTDSKKIKFALLECKPCDSKTYAKPSPESIQYTWYPLVRPLYYILKENSLGLGTGFVTFMSLERGQLIFRRSYLVPGKIDLNLRKSDI